MTDTSRDDGRGTLVRRPSSRVRPTTQARRHGPSPVLLVLAALTVAVVATPLVFLVAEIAGSASGAAWDALLRPRTLELTLNTLALVATVTAGTLLLGVPTAVLLVRTDLAWRTGWQVVAALPLAVPSYVAGFAWVSLTPISGFWGAALVLVLVSTPYVTIPVAAALRRADPDVEAVARTLGSGPLRAFWTATVPQIAPAAGAGALLAALYALSDFGVVAIMRYPAFTWAVHTAFTGTFNRSLALVLSLLLVALALLVVLAERALRRRAGVASRVRVDSRPTVRLGRWQVPAALALGALSLAAVGVPVVTWIVRATISVGTLETDVPRLLEAATTTVLLGLGGALLATVLALPLGVLAARHRTRTVAALETATFLAHGLPGIVLGLSMVSLVLLVAPAVYQTPLVLVIAYGILFVPKAAGAVRTSVAQVPVALEHSARTLGRSATGAWWSVTARLAWPGVASGALLVALTAMKELPATLLLRPTGTDTLSTRLWQLTDIAAYGAAAPYALLLIAVSAFPAFLLSRQVTR